MFIRRLSSHSNYLHGFGTWFRFLILSAVIIVSFTACSSSSTPPRSKNICTLFLNNPHWLWEAEKAQDRWGVPISVLMAVLHQESNFRKNAQPQRHKLFGIIPWFRPTTAEGYAQATNATWYVYCRNRHRISASRSHFSDAVDFVAWYISYAHQKLHISKQDAYRAYLAYHEGINGYYRAESSHNFWLKHIARAVKRRAAIYHQQLLTCSQTLPQKPWWY